MNKIFLFSLVICICLAEYKEDFGKQLCKLAVASYCKKSQVQNWSCAPCKTSPLQMTNVHTFQNKSMDTLGFIATNHKTQSIILVFRGTLPWDLKNWISDINFITIQYPLCNNKCRVHRGFYYAFMEINDQVIEMVTSYKAKYPGYKIIATGHSLGAAIATHVTAHLIANKFVVEELYTFGSPRVGDAKFHIWFNGVFGKGQKYRVTKHQDPVPHLPFEDWGFLHINNQIYYKGALKQGYKTCSDQSGGEDKNCSDKNKLDVNVIDHTSYYDIDFAGIIVLCQA